MEGRRQKLTAKNRRGWNEGFPDGEKVMGDGEPAGERADVMGNNEYGERNSVDFFFFLRKRWWRVGVVETSPSQKKDQKKMYKTDNSATLLPFYGWDEAKAPHSWYDISSTAGARCNSKSKMKQECEEEKEVQAGELGGARWGGKTNSGKSKREVEKKKKKARR